MSKHHPSIIHEPEEVLVFSINTDVETQFICSKEFFYQSNYKKGLSYLEGGSLYKPNDTFEFKMEIAEVEQIVTPLDIGRSTVDEYVKQYYIIEPRLERIMSAKYTEKIKDLTEKFVTATSLHTKAINDISHYNNLPWWKKLFTFNI